MRKCAIFGLLLGACALFGFAHFAQAQQQGQAVTTYGSPVWACAVVNSTGVAPSACPNNVSGAIVTTGTFQLVFPASVPPTRRVNCIIQNNGAAAMDIFLGPVALATAATSIVLAPGAIFYCGSPANGVIQDAVAITGTTTQTFYASQN
jgi:hypothetical protein